MEWWSADVVLEVVYEEGGAWCVCVFGEGKVTALCLCM